MAEESDWKKLPTVEKVDHKQWKARIEGYEEAIAIFNTQTSDKSPVFNEYTGLIKKMVTDSNAIAQEKALDAVMAFAENAAVACRVAGDVCSGIVSKCLNSIRAKTKEKGMLILLMYIELEKTDIVIDEVMKGLAAKQPKIVIGCIQSLREALSQFGSKVIAIKGLLKESVRLLDDRDPNIRNETKDLVVEMYRWVGAPIKSQLSGLKPVLLTELESEFAKVSSKPTPTRYLKSQKPKEDANNNNAISERTDGSVDIDVEETEEVDAFELADPVEILSNIPADYWEKIVSTKWKERKEALDFIEKLTHAIRLANGDYGELVKSLLTVMGKDTNALLVGSSAKIISQIANGLRKKYQTYAASTIHVCFEKFKERKVTILTAVRAAADAAEKSTTLESLQEDIIEALKNKNPGIRAETALFVSRSFSKMTITSLNKKMLKTFVMPLAKCSADMVLEVREAAFCALGTAMSVVTEKNILPFLSDLDTIRLARVKEFYEKTINDKKAEKSNTEDVTTIAGASGEAPQKQTFRVVKAAKRTPGDGDTTVAAEKPSTGSAGASTTKKPVVKRKQTEDKSPESLPKEQLWPDDIVLSKINDTYGESLVTELASVAWKERLAALESVRDRCNAAKAEEISCQLVLRMLMLKPGFKDTNFQVSITFLDKAIASTMLEDLSVLRMKIEIVNEVLQKTRPCSQVIIDLLFPEIIDKFGDAKSGDAVKQLFTTLAEASSFELIGDRVLKASFTQKNPKAQVEGLNWLSNSIKEFGLKLNTKDLVHYIKIGFGATNLQVRQASIYLSTVLFMYMGATLRTLLADEKPALIRLLEEEWSKMGDAKPPAPTRGIRFVRMESNADAPGDVAQQAADTEAPDPEDLIPRKDISDDFTPELLSLLQSKAWKERMEGLNQIQQVLAINSFIEGGSKMQEPLSAVAKVCTDVNKILGKSALGIVEKFAKALSKSDAKKLVRYILVGVLTCFGDSKPSIREAAVSALTAWRDRSGFIAMTDGDFFAEALKPENPYLRAELLGWLAISMDDLRASRPNTSGLTPEFREQIVMAVLPVCEDRKQEARSRAHSMLPVLLRAFGNEFVLRCTKRLKTPSSDSVQLLVEKAREQIAAEDAALKPTELKSAPKAIRGGGGGAGEPVVVVKKESPPPVLSETAAAGDEVADDGPSSVTELTTSSKSAIGPKKTNKRVTMTSKKAAALEQAEEAASVVPLQVNKLREVRMQDEKKRKLLKWDFDAPTKDHIQQLNQLFAAAGASSDLHTCLFHSDFRQHIRAVEIMSRLLDGAWSSVDGEAATRANLDLILRWMTLRFFETNPAVLTRGLEYLLKVFAHMADSEVPLTESEASAFLPYLVMKVGDSKDNIRRDIRAIFKTVVNIYPPARLYTFLINGLKSKVNRARQECLEELGILIENYGLNVCQPSPAASLKILAGQISDRDSGVRTAALNSLVSAYAIVGEPLWKMLGDLPEKDRSMLEERIKRSGRPSTAASNASSSKRSASERPSNRRDPAESVANGQIKQQPYMDALKPLGALSNPQNSLHSIAYAKAQNILGEYGDLSHEQPSEMPNLLEMDKDINEIFKPFEIPELKTRAPQPVLNVLLRTSPDAASAITMVVTQISSNDLNLCCFALSQIDALLQSDKWQLLMGHINQIIMLITIQLRQTNTRFFDDPSISPAHLSSVLRCLLATSQSIFKRPLLARECSRESLKEFLFAVLHLMVHEKTTELPDGSTLVRVINAITLIIINESNCTRVLSALIRLLHESVSSGHFSNRFTQVIMRSLWRITKALSETCNNYALDVILIDCHNFLKAFPSVSWKTRKSDVPLRTLKTMLHTFCVVRGAGVLKIADSIPNKEDSELLSYLNRTLKSLASSNGGNLPPTSQSLKTASPLKTAVISPVNRERITRLMEKIQESKDPLTIVELYDVVAAYPDIDLEPFLTNSTPFFQTYVRQALYNVGLQRMQRRPSNAYDRSNGLATEDCIATTNSSSPRTLKTRLKDNFTHLLRTHGRVLNFSSEQNVAQDDLSCQPANPKLFMDRLATLRQQIGLEKSFFALSEDSTGRPSDGRPSDSPFSKTTVFEDTLRGLVQPRSDEREGGSPPATANEAQPRQTGMSPTELMELKRRLAVIKNAQSRG